MAPTRPSNSAKGKGKSPSPLKKSSRSSKPTKPGAAPTGISKRKSKNLSLAKPGGAQKTKSKSKLTDGKRKKRVYSEAELDIPKLNGIVPAGIAKPKGQKKGKKFVDDAESMMAIMSMVNAEKEGHIESKIMKARQWEEVREAKRKEMEKRSEVKKAQFEVTKQSLKKKRKGRQSDPVSVENVENAPPETTKPKKKRVSFG